METLAVLAYAFGVACIAAIALILFLEIKDNE